MPWVSVSSRDVSGCCGSVGRSFDCSSAVKNEFLQCGSHRRRGFNLWVGKIPWRRAWQPTPVFLPGKSHGKRSLTGYSPWGCKESDMTKATERTCGGLLTGSQGPGCSPGPSCWSQCRENFHELLASLRLGYCSSRHVMSPGHFPWQASHAGHPPLIVHRGRCDCLFCN